MTRLEIVNLDFKVHSSLRETCKIPGEEASFLLHKSLVTGGNKACWRMW